MFRVDPSGWIDYSPKCCKVSLPIATSIRQKNIASLIVIELGGLEIAIQAAKNYRKLRDLGLTSRKTIDTVIVTRCSLLSRISGYGLCSS